MLILECAYRSICNIISGIWAPMRIFVRRTKCIFFVIRGTQLEFRDYITEDKLYGLITIAYK